MRKKLSIKELQDLIKNKTEKEVGKILSGEESGNWCGIWYDWFCKDDELEKRAGFFTDFIKGLKGDWINTHYVWLKNNCPMVGDLYDDIRISPISDEEASYNVLLINRPDNDEHLSVVDTRKETAQRDLYTVSNATVEDAINCVNGFFE